MKPPKIPKKRRSHPPVTKDLGRTKVLVVAQIGAGVGVVLCPGRLNPPELSQKYKGWWPPLSLNPKKPKRNNCGRAIHKEMRKGKDGTGPRRPKKLSDSQLRPPWVASLVSTQGDPVTMIGSLAHLARNGARPWGKIWFHRGHPSPRRFAAPGPPPSAPAQVRVGGSGAWGSGPREPKSPTKICPTKI